MFLKSNFFFFIFDLLFTIGSMLISFYLYFSGFVRVKGDLTSCWLGWITKLKNLFSEIGNETVMHAGIGKEKSGINCEINLMELIVEGNVFDEIFFSIAWRKNHPDPKLFYRFPFFYYHGRFDLIFFFICGWFLGK